MIGSNERSRCMDVHFDNKIKVFFRNVNVYGLEPLNGSSFDFDIGLNEFLVFKMNLGTFWSKLNPIPIWLNELEIVIFF